MHRFRKLTRSYHAPRVFIAATVVSVIFAGGVASAFLVDDPRLRAAIVFLVGFALLFTLLGGLGLLYLAVREHDLQVRSLVNLRPVYGSQPLRTGGWAADPHMLESLMLLLQEKQPSAILELGSGASTIVTAEYLRARGGGRLVSVDHEARFAAATRAQLVARGLDSYVDVVVAPLSVQYINGREYNWYTTDWKQCITEPVDFLVVDGPPARLQSQARYPAFPLLAPLLAADCTIVLDDGSRADERMIAAEWAATSGRKARYTPFGKGMWVLEHVQA